MDRRQLLIGGGTSLGVLYGDPTRAAGGTMKFVYPYAPGSGGDGLVRLLAEAMRTKLGVSTIVDNKTGADGRIGVRDVKQSAPDGMTLLFTPFGTMVLFPSVFANLGYDAFNDFTPVTQVATFDFGLATGTMTTAKTLAELVAWMKSNPDQSNVAIPGLGALPHLLPLKFAMDSGTKIQPVPYKGTMPALTSVIAGQVPLVCAPLGDLVTQAKAGSIRLLAVSGKDRSAFAPDVPTFIEQGYQISGSGWYAIFAPAKTPVAEVETLNKALVDSIRSSEFQERARSLWLAPTGTTPAELGVIQKEDFERWAPVVKAAALEPQ
jgi:tripartite-type tricarboxylate transporter receptor subunit TctC